MKKLTSTSLNGMMTLCLCMGINVLILILLNQQRLVNCVCEMLTWCWWICLAKEWFDLKLNLKYIVNYESKKVLLFFIITTSPLIFFFFSKFDIYQRNWMGMGQYLNIKPPTPFQCNFQTLRLVVTRTEMANSFQDMISFNIHM